MKEKINWELPQKNRKLEQETKPFSKVIEKIYKRLWLVLSLPPSPPSDDAEKRRKKIAENVLRMIHNRDRCD